MAIYGLNGDKPELSESTYVANEALVIGKVRLGENSSVWHGAVLRGDNDHIEVGQNVNIQDGAVVHTDEGFPAVIGDNVSVGHQAILHGCRIGRDTLVGMQAVIMNGAVIGEGCIVGAGSVVTEGKVFEDGWLLLGAPAKPIRKTTEKDVAGVRSNAEGYVLRQAMFRGGLVRLD